MIILGAIGINFGAGMSGGIAYLYDPTGDSRPKINPGLVDIESLTSEDEVFLKEKINNFIDNTKAEESRHFIDNWEEEKKHFIKIMPRDYRRALEKKTQEKMAS